MLKKVVDISGLGLLHHTGSSPNFSAATLLFAENGRGKSTFTALIASLRTGDVTQLKRLQTIDQQVPVEAKLIFDDGANISELTAGGWDQQRSAVRVFDSRFIRDNVYSGSVVDIDHRRHLLEFALGDRAVAESVREREATERSAELTAQIKQGEARLVPYLHGWTTADFERLLPVPDIESEIQSADAGIVTRRNVESILARPRPATIGLLDADVADILAVLRLELQQVEDQSERLAREHFAQVHHEGVEEWVRGGEQFEDGHTCPYCGQSVDSSALLAAYRSFFGQEYRALVEKIAARIQEVNSKFGPQYVQALTARVAVERECHAVWATDAQLPPFGLLDTTFQTAYRNLHDLLLESLRLKEASPLTALFVDEDVSTAVSMWSEIGELFAELNTSCLSNNELIDQYVARLQTDDLAELLEQREKLEGLRARFLPEVVAIIESLNADRLSLLQATSEKSAARDSVRALMNGTLSTFQDKINQLLGEFGAGFVIEAMKTNFVGSAPQSEFVIGLRQNSVPLKSVDGPDFDSALSEGDKRTLAFAFFAAQLLADSQIADLVVVIDDPMSSMDASRRTTTVSTILAIQQMCAQVILSSHDPSFLREYRRASQRQDRTRAISEVELKTAAVGYSVWGAASLDILCESPYLKMQREVIDFLERGTGDFQYIATCLRPLLEGYLHRRFPMLLAEGLMLGECLQAIRSAVSPSPLAYAAGLANEIESINSYAGAFHHSGDPGYVQAIASAAEVRTFSQRVIDVMHGKP